jgi:predicted nucleic acid-binding Zn ribbon protein
VRKLRPFPECRCLLRAPNARRKAAWPAQVRPPAADARIDGIVEPLQSAAAGVIAEAIRRQPPSPARTTFAWSVAAGPAMARAATVEVRDGVLLITPKDARWAREIERAASTLLDRIQLLVGATEVTSLRICVKP